MPRRAAAALALLLAVCAAAVRGQDKPPVPATPTPAPSTPPAAAPTADQVKDALAKFKAERAEAEKTFTKEELATADELAGRAEAALAGGNAANADRLVTDARWKLPILPAGLPKNVVRVLGAGRLRHGDRVNSLAYTPDGRFLVSGSRDGTARVWDVGNGREVLAYRGHEGVKYTAFDDTNVKDAEKANVRRVPAVAVSPDGTLAASCGGGEIHVWELASGKKVKTLKGHKKDVSSLAFGKTNDVLVSGGDDKLLVVWDVPAEKPQWTSSEMGGIVNAVGVSADARAFGCVDAAGYLTVFGFAKEPPLLCGVQVVGKAATGVAFARDGQGVFASGYDGKVSLTNAVDATGGRGRGDTVRRYEAGENAVNAVAVSRDGKLVAAGCGPFGTSSTRSTSEQPVLVWEVDTGKQVRALPGHTSPVVCVTIRPDGRQIAAGGEDGSIRLWPFAQADEHRAATDAKDNVWAVAVSPDGKLYAAAGADRTVRVYDTATGALKKELTGHAKAVTAVAFVSDSVLATAGGDKAVKLWDVAAGTAKDLAGHTSAVLAVGVGGGGRLLASGGADKAVRGWNAADGAPLWAWTGKSAVCAVAVREDGKRVAVGTADGSFVVLDVTGKEPTVVSDQVGHQSGVAAVAYSPGTGDKLATCGGDGLARLWAAPDAGNPVRQVDFTPPGFAAAAARRPGTPAPPPPPLSAVAFSADGRYLAAAGGEGVVRVWDAATAAEFRGLRGHAGWVTSAAFTPDGRGVVSCGVDQTVRLFELPRPDGAAAGHSGEARSVAVSRDGRYAATGGQDGAVKVWDLTTGREVATLVAAGGTTVSAVAFRGSEQVVASAINEGGGRLVTWTFKPAKLVSDLKAPKAFYLAAPEDGKTLGTAWAGTPPSGGDKQPGGFDVYAADPAAPATVKLDDLSAAAVSPDAAWGVSGRPDGTLTFWDLTKKQKVGGDWPITKNVVADLGFTPDRKTVVVIDATGEVKVGDVARREVTATVKAVIGEVKGVVVSPTGDKFATLGGNGEIKAWDMSGKELRTWKLGHPANAAAFTVDGKRLLTANTDGSAFVLELP